MNASFRTAFWALCLGLTVPMVLFVGVELASGGRARRAIAGSAADQKSSLRTRLSETDSKANGSRIAAVTSNADREIFSGARASKNGLADGTLRDKVVLDPPEVDPADLKIVLGPGVEADPAAIGPATGRDRRVSASSVAETRPRVQILPEIETVPAVSAPSNAIIEARLAGIQQHLDKLGRAIDEKSNREFAGDPIKQATELLKQLHEAHLIQTPVTQREESADRRTNDGVAGSQQDGSATPLPVNDISSDAAAAKSVTRKTDPKSEPITRIYRPRYLSGSALHALVMPLLTPNLGRAGAADAGTDDATSATGGHAAAPADALVVFDVPDVLRKVDLLFQKLDTAPAHVVIEAVVLSVRINHGMPNGIDLLEFNGPGQPFAVSAVDGGFSAGAVGADDPLLLTRKYGLKRGILSGDPHAFLSALQAATQMRRLDAWQMTVANRQAADLMLTDPCGSCNQATAGTILKIRPIVARNGEVHLDVRRDLSLDVAASGTRAAALTNLFSLHDGQTAVIGGFLADQPAIQYYRPPGVGQIPVVGELFRKTAEAVERTETIILLTPHIVATAAEAQVAQRTRPAAGAPDAAKAPRIVPTSGTSSQLKTASPRLRPMRKQQP
ncbi:MAG: hypothetical protein HY290_20045 [Planctomycetia bacterium]|nr:hypothetical protein [Planctomycetia bacterium]